MIEIQGSQQKFIEDGNYYKLDGEGYHSLSEYVVSHLYSYSNVDDYVIYDLAKVKIDGVEKVASKSKNFLNESEKVVTLQELYKEVHGNYIEEDIVRIEDIHDRIKYIVDFVEKKTHIKDFGNHLTMLLEIDDFFLNDDRHFFNISLIKNKDGIYRTSPVFDNGAMLLSATNVYKLENSIEENMKKYFSLPFSINPLEQKEAAEKLYGNNFIIQFDKKIIDNLLKDAENFYEEKVLERIRKILYGKIGIAT